MRRAARLWKGWATGFVLGACLVTTRRVRACAPRATLHVVCRVAHACYGPRAEVLGIRKRVHGAEHPDTLLTAGNLGGVSHAPWRTRSCRASSCICHTLYKRLFHLAYDTLHAIPVFIAGLMGSLRTTKCLRASSLWTVSPSHRRARAVRGCPLAGGPAVAGMAVQWGRRRGRARGAAVQNFP